MADLKAPTVSSAGAGLPQVDQRPRTTRSGVYWEILPASATPDGRPVLIGSTPHEVLLFPMSAQQAQDLGQALTAPRVQVPRLRLTPTARNGDRAGSDDPAGRR